MEPTCVFCRLIKGAFGKIDILAEDDYAILIRDKNPVAKDHVLAISREHWESLSKALNDNTQQCEDRGHNKVYWHGTPRIQAILQLATQWADENLPNGYRITTNTGADAGQAVKHLHFHVMGGEPLKGL